MLRSASMVAGAALAACGLSACSSADAGSAVREVSEGLDLLEPIPGTGGLEPPIQTLLVTHRAPNQGTATMHIGDWDLLRVLQRGTTSTADITGTCTFASSDVETVAIVGGMHQRGGKLVRGADAGKATISATCGGSPPLSIEYTITTVQLDSVLVSGNLVEPPAFFGRNPTLPLGIGAATNLYTYAEYSDNTLADVSSLAAYHTLADAFTLQLIGELGARVTGVAAGNGALWVNYGSGGVTLDVTVK